jgi:SAM-dependent methyltransferase
VDIDTVLTQDEFPVYPSIDEVPGTFDLITIIQTLEHLNDPRKMVMAIYDHLNPGGSVIVEVPNRRAYLAAFVPPEHVVAYDEMSLRSLFIGYKDIKVLYHGQALHSPLDLYILLTANK